jgi:hypothetical protein
MSDKETGKRQLRSFGLIVGGGFAVLALAPAVFHGQGLRIWALALGFLLAAAALIFPVALRPIFRVWMWVGELLGWVNTRIILLLVYYAVIVPIGGLLRMTGKDPMRLKFEQDAKSYRILRTKRPASHMQRQY